MGERHERMFSPVSGLTTAKMQNTSTPYPRQRGTIRRYRGLEQSNATMDTGGCPAPVCLPVEWLTECTEMHRKIEFGNCVLVVRNRKMGERHERMFSPVSRLTTAMMQNTSTPYPRQRGTIRRYRGLEQSNATMETGGCPAPVCLPVEWLTECTEMHRKIEFGNCVLV